MKGKTAPGTAPYFTLAWFPHKNGQQESLLGIWSAATSKPTRG